MAGERRINWGADATDARYRTEDTGDGANFVVVEDLDGATVLLEYDDSRTPSEWVVRGPVDLNGNDLSGVGIANTDELQNINYVEPQQTATESTSYTADLAASNYHKLTLTGDVAIDVNNVDATDVNSVLFQLVQDGTGGRTPSFTPTVIWPGSFTFPDDLSTAANAIDAVTLVHDQDGSQWLGFPGGSNFA